MSDPRAASGYSSEDLISMGFIATPHLAKLPLSTRPVSDMALDDFDAIAVAGAQAPMSTFERATVLQEKLVEFFEAVKVAAAPCHGALTIALRQTVERQSTCRRQDCDGIPNTEEGFADNAMGVCRRCHTVRT